jgi:hypothetical protein
LCVYVCLPTLGGGDLVNGTKGLVGCNKWPSWICSKVSFHFMDGQAPTKTKRKGMGTKFAFFGSYPTLCVCIHKGIERRTKPPPHPPKKKKKKKREEKKERERENGCLVVEVGEVGEVGDYEDMDSGVDFGENSSVASRNRLSPGWVVYTALASASNWLCALCTKRVWNQFALGALSHKKTNQSSPKGPWVRHSGPSQHGVHYELQCPTHAFTHPR